MTNDMATFQTLLAEMRAAFLDELPERCAGFEALILHLEQVLDDREAFNALYRGIHSLKGSGGTHGLGIVTSLCHQLENLLSEIEVGGAFDRTFASQALAYVDLLRRVPGEAANGDPDCAAITVEMERMRRSALHSRKAVLIAESSATLAGFYRQALASLPVLVVVKQDGLVALEHLLHEPFDLVIVGRELKTLNGIALMAAVRAAEGRNRNVPAILLSSQSRAVPMHAGFDTIIRRDAQQTASLAAAARRALRLA